MNHYEIIQLIHPNQGMHIDELMSPHKSLIKEKGGKLHRFEDIGRCRLAYLMKKNHKAHFILMNIECEVETMEAIKRSLYYNDIVMRSLIIRVKTATTTPSCLVQPTEEGDKKRIKIEDIDYKNVDQLSKFLNENYKINPARISQVSSKMQRQIKKAIKRARFLGLIPYCDNHVIYKKRSQP